MQYVYAAMLLHSAGQHITESSVKKVIESTGAKADETRIKALVAALEGVDIEKAMKEAAMPVAAAPVAAAAPAAGGAPKQEKKEEKKDETQAAAGLGALFG